MNSDDIFWLRKKEQHLTEWVSRYRKAGDALPYVQMNLDMTKWQIDALSNVPTISGDIPVHYSGGTIEADYRYTTNAMPLMPNYDVAQMSTATSIATSGTISAYDYVASFGDRGTTKATEYSQKYTQQYNDLQKYQRRTEQVRQLVEKFGSNNTLERFNAAIKSYWSTKSEAIPRKQAALDMRNLLDGLKGDLFKMARSVPRENMKWDKMSERLSKGTPNGAEHQELIKQESIRSTLIDRLSDILKDRESGSATNLNHLWTEVLDHIYTVCGLLNPALLVHRRDQYVGIPKG